MHDTMNKMKKLVFSLAAVAMAAVASVNVYNVNANAVEMSDLQKENVEALAGGEKSAPVHSGKFFNNKTGYCNGRDANCIKGVRYPGY